MPYADPERQREYMRQWIAKRRADWLAGKSCVRCGATDRFDIDHIDPRTKVDHRVWSWSQARRDAELAKCQVLCEPCHQIKTADDEGWIIGHGGPSSYKKGCRCEPCREVQSAKCKAWRKRTGYSGTVGRERARVRSSTAEPEVLTL